MEGGHVFERTGGRLCLDFTNTVDERPGPAPRERLVRYEDLVSWARQAGALSPAEATRLGRLASAWAPEAEAVRVRAVALREVLFGIFRAVARDATPARDDMLALNRALPGALGRLRLAPEGDGFRWAWDPDPRALDRMLWPVLRSAVDLLASREARRSVRICAAEDCGWIFLDSSRNQSRRWCDMKVCGNRDKARRHYQRMKRARRARKKAPRSARRSRPPERS